MLVLRKPLISYFAYYVLCATGEFRICSMAEFPISAGGIRWPLPLLGPSKGTLGLLQPASQLFQHSYFAASLLSQVSLLIYTSQPLSNFWTHYQIPSIFVDFPGNQFSYFVWVLSESLLKSVRFHFAYGRIALTLELLGQFGRILDENDRCNPPVLLILFSRLLWL